MKKIQKFELETEELKKIMKKGQTKYKSLKEEKDWDDEIEKEAQFLLINCPVNYPLNIY